MQSNEPEMSRNQNCKRHEVAFTVKDWRKPFMPKDSLVSGNRGVLTPNNAFLRQGSCKRLRSVSTFFSFQSSILTHMDHILTLIRLKGTTASDQFFSSFLSPSLPLSLSLSPSPPSSSSSLPSPPLPPGSCMLAAFPAKLPAEPHPYRSPPFQDPTSR
eukprot:756080-Hanusia_phi.AAC.1